MTNELPTLIACLTPPGRGAIATLGVRGPMAWTITRELFRRTAAPAKGHQATAPLPEEPTPGRYGLGWLGEPTRAFADEVVLLVKELNPPWLELHCHGGPLVIQFVQDLFTSRGCEAVPWTEFDRGRIPEWQLAAQHALVQAPTVRTANIALDQWHGAFRKTIAQIRGDWTSDRRQSALEALRRQIALSPVGRHLVAPWRVVLASAPNVGKSSLSNALAGFARSVVAATPGTTRDVVTTRIALDGWLIEIADTAGLRSACDDLEDAGIARAEAAIASADLCLWLLDGSSAPVWPESKPDHMMLVINKIDLPRAWDWGEASDAVRLSAKTSEGLPALGQAIVSRLVSAAPLPGEGVPHTEQQRTALEQLATALGAKRDDDMANLLDELLQ